VRLEVGDRQTDRQMDGIAVASTVLAMRALQRTAKTLLRFSVPGGWRPRLAGISTDCCYGTANAVFQRSCCCTQSELLATSAAWNKRRRNSARVWKSSRTTRTTAWSASSTMSCGWTGCTPSPRKHPRINCTCCITCES